MFLEEGFNVKVVLLPEGEDPDSYAQSHNASDFIDYIQTHQTDFIRFKAALLREEAGGDPQKRANLIKDITQSVAQIPDAITRQVYIRDSAEKLQINEQLLTREVARLRREKIAELTKAQQEKERMAAFAQDAEELTTAGQTAEAAASSRSRSKFDQNYRNLLQLIVRSGERPLFRQEDGTIIQVGEYILSQLEADAIEPPTPLYRKVIEEYAAHKADEGFVAENFFKFHPDVDVSRLAVDLIADRYQLSRMFTKQSISENVVVDKQEQEDEQLPGQVMRLLYEIKLTVVEKRIEQLAQQIREAQEADNWEQLRALAQLQPQLLEVRDTICRQLGNRVITG